MKQQCRMLMFRTTAQPPSGGCVLKLHSLRIWAIDTAAATFGWLCVETYINLIKFFTFYAATFGRLCVETKLNKVEQYNIYSATTLSLNPIHTQQHSLLNFPLIRSRLCPIFSFHDLQLCVFLTFILTYLMS